MPFQRRATEIQSAMRAAQNPNIFSLWLIVSGAVLFATLALYVRQPLPVS
ncbi:MAG: hypothetical protein WBE39_11525 [Candidatus Competibacter sp.]